MESKLEVLVKSATELRNKPSQKLSQFVSIRLRGSANQTRWISDETNIEWNETLTWKIRGLLDPSEALDVEVFQKSMIMFSQLTAKTQIPLQAAVETGFMTVEATLQDQRGSVIPNAKLLVDVTYSSPMCDEVEAPPIKPTVRKKSWINVPSLTGGFTKRTLPTSQPIDESEDENESNSTIATHTQWIGDLPKSATFSNIANMPNKPTDFQLRIHIIEARKLEGEFVRALVKVAVGNVVKETSTKYGTNNPFWDETLVYNFKEHPQLLMDKAVKFKVLNTRKILKDAVIGSFEFDVGLAYSEPDHCFIHKWLLLTEPHDSTGKPKGFLKISINVLGPGMDSTPSPSICSPDNVDIESNLLRPSRAQIQPATLHVRIFEASDLPQMDPAYFNKFKKLFNPQATPKDLVDPYVTLSIAGHHGKTKVIWNDQDPQWNQQLNMAIRFPLFSERIRFQLKDKDQTTADDLIGTYFMKLSQISPNDHPPTFGPCFVNFYGSPREFSDLGDAYEYLNEGVLEGVAYRGRLLVEVTTSVGVLPKEKYEEIKPYYIKATKPFLKKCRYKLCCAFLSASMIEPFEDTVEFEVSIGNYGYKLDEGVCPQMSSTPPLKPMWDGNEYYFLPWMDKKPVVMVDSEWEDCNYRIETANLLENITERLVHMHVV